MAIYNGISSQLPHVTLILCAYHLEKNKKKDREFNLPKETQ